MPLESRLVRLIFVKYWMRVNDGIYACIDYFRKVLKRKYNSLQAARVNHMSTLTISLGSNFTCPDIWSISMVSKRLSFVNILDKLSVSLSFYFELVIQSSVASTILTSTIVEVPATMLKLRSFNKG